MLALLITSMIVVAFKIQTVKAAATTITINPDGSISPPSAPISSVDNVTYTFTGNISYPAYNGVVVDGNNIVVDGNGYTVQGSYTGTVFYETTGFTLTDTRNVTIENANIQGFYDGVYLIDSDNSVIGWNNVTANSYGIVLSDSSNNTVSGNNITANSDYGMQLDTYSNSNVISWNDVTANIDGIVLFSSSGNIFTGNDETANSAAGIYIWESSNNSVSWNNETANSYGIYLGYSSNTSVIGNNLTADSGGAIELTSSSNNSVSGNDVTATDIGMYLDDSSNNNVISGNSITANDEGIWFFISNDNNTVSDNHVTANSEGIILQRSSNNNTVSGNDVTGSSMYSIEVELSSNNVVSGNTVTANSYDFGIYVSDSSNNSVSWNDATANWDGICLVDSSNNTVNGNNATANADGIALVDSSNNTVNGNNATANSNDGIFLYYFSDYNSISEDNITNNYDGIGLYSSSNYNSIIANNVTANSHDGISLSYSSNNTIHRNNFVGNSVQASVDSASVGNAWDEGYPFGGNYWSDYNGTDLYSGPYQNITGSDGIGDTPFVIDVNNRDHYPLMKPSASYVPVMFAQAGVGSDFNGTVLTVDGTQYGVASLPITFTWNVGSIHTFAYSSPLVAGAKQYDWNFTSRSSMLQWGSINVTGPGSVTGNYVTHVHDVAVVNVTADRTWVYQGRTANINVTVWDNGDFPENVTVTLYYNITGGNVAGVQNVTVLSGQNATLTFSWNTAGVAPCYTNYTFTAVATIPADYTPADNTLSDGKITVRILGDINGDGVVDGSDIALAAQTFGSYGPNFLYPGSPPSPRWNLDCDLNGEGVVDGSDIVLVATNFGK
jgi:parallel beta-helix repeat protein